MKRRHVSIGSLAIAGMLISCIAETDFGQLSQTGIPINLESYVNHIQTKVNVQGFEDGDGLGLYAVNYENDNQTPGTLKDEGNQVDNVKYVFDEKNWKWTPVRPVYYKDINTNVDLYAFYPHAEPSSVSAYNFEVQKDQSTARNNNRLGGYEASDFLWGKSENIAPTESAIKVQLNHMMSGAYVVLKKGTGFEAAEDFSLLDKKVLVTNTTRKSAINLANGQVTPIGEAQATGIVMAPQSDGSFRAIIVPQTVQAGIPLFSITIEGQSYSFAKESSYTYVAGKLSLFTIIINRKQPSGEYELILDDNQIIDWKEDLNTHEREARQYYCVHCEEPGTLGRHIKGDKKNPDKIRNLKVSGKISDEDFSFMRDSMAILESINLREVKVVDVVNQETWGKLPNGEYGVIEGEDCVDDVIPYWAFAGKSTLVNFVFPEEIKSIGGYAFFSCHLLSGALILPDSIKIIEPDAFYGCTNLTSISLPANLEAIGHSAFRSCIYLGGNLQLPNTLEYIGHNAFENCSQFVGSLVLPSSLTYLGMQAFEYCAGFTGDLKIPESIKELHEGTYLSSIDLSLGNHPVRHESSELPEQ